MKDNKKSGRAGNAALPDENKMPGLLGQPGHCLDAPVPTRPNTPPVPRGEGGRWIKGGPSPNPTGRPPDVPNELKELARAKTADAITTLSEVMMDGSQPGASRVAAATALLDRGWGKPLQSVEAKVERFDIGAAHLAALKAFAARLPVPGDDARPVPATVIDANALP